MQSKRGSRYFKITTDPWGSVLFHYWKIGVAHSLVLTGSMTPLLTNLSSSFSTLGLMAYRTGLALRHLGVVPGLTVSLTVMSFMLPSSHFAVFFQDLL